MSLQDNPMIILSHIGNERLVALYRASITEYIPGENMSLQDNPMIILSLIGNERLIALYRASITEYIYICIYIYFKEK